MSAGDLNDDDTLVLIALGVLALPTIGAVVATRWDAAQAWLVDRHVLVDHALLPLWGMHGRGLDLPRLVLLVAAAVIVFVVATAVRRRARATRSTR